ncbi:MAG: DUF4439 domain-containing protein [Candidatus Nanopelagicales bacterium]
MSDAAIENLTQALNGEYAATYAYGVIGARTSGADQARARRALESHRQLRDELRIDLAALQAPVPPPAPAYETGQIDSPAQAKTLAIGVEQRLVRNWAAVATTSADASRERAVRNAQECGTRAISWGAASQAFPG